MLFDREALEMFGNAEVADFARDYELRDKITKELTEYAMALFRCVAIRKIFVKP